MMRMKKPQASRRSLLRTLSLLLAVPFLCMFALKGVGAGNDKDPIIVPGTVGTSMITGVTDPNFYKRVNIGTPEKEIGLPSTLSCTFEGGYSDKVPVSWSCPNYNRWEEGTYYFSSSIKDNYHTSPSVKFPAATVIVERWERPDPPPRPPRRPSSDTESVSAFKDGEYDFWKAVRRKILNADSGDTIHVQARRYDKFPEIVMRALQQRTGVSLLIEWNGGGDIFIPAGDALYDGTRLFWPLRELEDIYGDSWREDIPSAAPQPVPDTKPEATPPPTTTSGKPSAGTGGFSQDAGSVLPDAGIQAAALSPAVPAVTGAADIIDADDSTTDTADISTVTNALERPSAVPTVSKPSQQRTGVKATVTGGIPSVPVQAAQEAPLPEALVMTVVLLAVLALCGVFTGAWLFSRKAQIRK